MPRPVIIELGGVIGILVEAILVFVIGLMVLCKYY